MSCCTCLRKLKSAGHPSLSFFERGSPLLVRKWQKRSKTCLDSSRRISLALRYEPCGVGGGEGAMSTGPRRVHCTKPTAAACATDCQEPFLPPSSCCLTCVLRQSRVVEATRSLLPFVGDEASNNPRSNRNGKKRNEIATLSPSSFLSRKFMRNKRLFQYG